MNFLFMLSCNCTGNKAQSRFLFLISNCLFVALLIFIYFSHPFCAAYDQFFVQFI